MHQQPIDNHHARKRHVLRIIGPIIFGLGLVLTAIGFGTVVLGDPFGHKLLAALSFVGLPLMFVGAVLSMMGFSGAVARYQAGEYAPVATDTLNYMAEGTQDGVRTVAKAIGEGLRGEAGSAELTCPACGAANEAGSKFCDQCGGPIDQPITCPDCGAENEAGSKFCDQCGAALGRA